MVKFKVSDACETISAMFEKVGMDKSQALVMSKVLVQTDQCGVHTHGMVAVPRYIKLIQNGQMRPNIAYDVVRDNGIIAVWDAKRSAGQVMGYTGMNEAISKAKKNGVGIVCIKGGNHFGALEYYARMAQKSGMVGIVLSSAVATVAPFGGCEKMIGNNPIAIAAPAGKELPPSLDMAMATVANGKITNMMLQGATEIPEGWGLDRDGLPTTRMSEFYTVPIMAGYKGWALDVMVDILAGILFGGATGLRAGDALQGPGVFMMALDVDAFNDRATYCADMDNRITELKSSKPAKGSQGISMPGERSERTLRASEQSGLMETLPEILASVNDLAASMGIAPIATV